MLVIKIRRPNAHDRSMRDSAASFHTVVRGASMLAWALGVFGLFIRGDMADAQSKRHAAPIRYVSATADADGTIRITTADGRVIHPVPLEGQRGFEKPTLAPDHHTVGWLALFANPGGTTYPIPLSLVLYTNGRTREIQGDGLMIGAWRFEKGGRRVAFDRRSVHGEPRVFELYDVVTGAKLSEYDPRGRTGQPPNWVKALGQSSRQP